MGAYRLEISKGNRAGCKNKECLENGVKIQKGELRFGTQVEFQEHQTWHWRHWGCVTPKQLANWKEISEGDEEMLDGFEDITPEMQEKVKVALEQGHVDDNDWKGDVEFNRPGKIGMRKRTPKKAGDDMAENHEDELNPTKPGPKKRARTKKTADEQEEEPDEAPSPKKTKTAAKRSKKAEATEANANSDDQKSVAKKKPKRGKEMAVAEAQEMSEKEAPIPKTKRNSRKPASTDAREDSGEEPAAPKRGKANGKGAATKKTKAPTSKSEPEENDMDFKEGIEDLPPAKKDRKKASAPKKTTKSRAKKTGTEAVDAGNPIAAE